MNHLQLLFTRFFVTLQRGQVYVHVTVRYHAAAQPVRHWKHPTNKREGKGQEKKTTGKARLLGKESMAGHKIGP
jgi:hypothetical protein